MATFMVNGKRAIGIEHSCSRMTGTNNYRIIELDSRGYIAGYMSDAVYLFLEDALEDAVEFGADEDCPVLEIADD